MNTSSMVMRDVFIEEIYKKMKTNNKIFFLSVDFGSPMLDCIRKDFSKRFINVGIAEQNSLNIATGLTLEGFTVYVYGIAPFITMRAYEQIRMNLAMLSQLRKINVNIIGVGAGMSYIMSGPTHHCLEDISIMRTLPNILLFCPSDCVQVKKFVEYTIRNQGPKYIRLEGKPVLPIYNEKQQIDFSTGFYELFKGKDVCLIATGYMTNKALSIRTELAKEKVDVGVIDFFLLRPYKEDQLSHLLKKYKYIITLEEGFQNTGGLGALVIDILNKRDLMTKIITMGIDNHYNFEKGEREYLHQLNRVDKKNIIKKIKEISC